MGILDNIKKKYDIDEEKNVQQFVYGTPDYFKNLDRKLVFEAFEGGYFGPSHFYYIRKYDKSYYEFKYGYSESGKRISEIDEDEGIKIILKPEQYYKDFVKELSSIISKWEKSYVDENVMDGTQWDINSEENNFEYSGSNKFPNDYKEAIKIINKYFDARDTKNYDIAPEDNIPQKVYGIPNSMNNKYDIDPERNTPQRVYGVPNAMNSKYDIAPEDNAPREVYGIPDSVIKNIREKNWNGKDETIKIRINDNNSNFIILLTKKIKECSMCFVKGNLEDNYIGDVSIKFPLSEFDEYSKRLLMITNDWLPTFGVDSNRKKAKEDLHWLIDIDVKFDGKKYEGQGEIPINWNEFIDCISELEIVFKEIKSKNNKILNPSKNDNLDNIINKKI